MKIVKTVICTLAVIILCSGCSFGYGDIEKDIDRNDADYEYRKEYIEGYDNFIEIDTEYKGGCCCLNIKAKSIGNFTSNSLMSVDNSENAKEFLLKYKDILLISDNFDFVDEKGGCKATSEDKSKSVGVYSGSIVNGVTKKIKADYIVNGLVDDEDYESIKRFLRESLNADITMCKSANDAIDNLNSNRGLAGIDFYIQEMSKDSKKLKVHIEKVNKIAPDTDKRYKVNIEYTISY